MRAALGDLQIVLEQHADVLRDNALPFRILIVLRALGLLLSLIPSAYGFLSLSPIQLFSIEVWRIATAPFVGKNIFLFAWTLWSLHIGTNVVRQANTNEAILKTFLVSQLFSTASVCVCGLVCYTLFGHTALLYDNSLVDMVAVNTAVLVLMKQFLPDSILFTTPLGRGKYTHLPGFAVLFTSLGAVFGVFRWAIALQCLFAVQAAWTYLRFFNPHESDDIQGDDSEHFTWATLFPRRLQPLCTIAGRICFRSLVKFGVCKRRVRHVDLHSLQSVSIQLPGLDSTVRDAERRRQKALRDLNDRLSRMRKEEEEPAIRWDEDEDEEVVVENVHSPVPPAAASATTEVEADALSERTALSTQPNRSEETHAVD